MVRFNWRVISAILIITTVSACGGGSDDGGDGGGDGAGDAGSSGSAITGVSWTWVSGSDVVDQNGVYGTKGTPDANNVPGARRYAATWSDSSGNLWLFGGIGFDSTGSQDILNDLWRFNPATGQWTWISGSNVGGLNGVYGTQGTASATNVPGARMGAVFWIDGSDKLWLLGGFGHDASNPGIGRLNDLWSFDPATGHWTWVKGSSLTDQNGVYGTKGTPDAANVPGSRSYATSWIDASGNFWLFGGEGYGSASLTADHLNDLWKYNPVSGEWTWISGSDVTYQVGVYGTKGTASATNVPGSRSYAASWIDSNGKLWLFGGWGLDSDLFGSGDINDLWQFDPVTGHWTWISGSDVEGQYGVYGTQGTASAANVPGARIAMASWIDGSDNLWLLGGWGYVASGTRGALNDLWKFNPATGEWTWMSGSNALNSSGVYGTKGTPDTGNVPGGRRYAMSWTDGSGNHWLFGGLGYDSAGTEGHLNGLWRSQP